MFDILKKHILLFGVLCLSMACDRSEQTTRRITEDAAVESPAAKDAAIVPSGPEAEDSPDIDLMLSAGSEHYLKKEYREAIDRFTEAHRIDGNNLTALINLGNLHYDTKQNIKAIGFYEKALKIEPHNLDVRCDMATCYYGAGMVEKAIEINRETIEMDFTHAQSHHNLAVFLQSIGKEEEALEEKRIYDHLISDQHR